MTAFPLRWCAAALALCLAGAAQAAQAWPEQPITLVVPFGAGGITDLTARTVARQLQAELGKPVIVENKPGAGGNIAADIVARAKPDGYTLMIITNGMVAVNPLIHRQLGYDAFRDFAYVSMIASTPLVLVVPDSSPVKDLPSLIGRARTRPEAVSFASSGQGTSIHQVFALLQKETGTSLMHVPYKSGAEAATALLSGVVDVTAVETVVVGPFVQSGKMRALGVTSSKPVPNLPEVPVASAGLGAEFDVGSISGLVAPAATPASILAALERAMQVVAQSDGMAQLYAQGSQPMPTGSRVFQERMRQEEAKWRRVFAGDPAK
ncbi:tripartite tricarboxylate transporter substrate binding protein [Achromobacter denitrificans]|uniref:Tripartite tricarboxylate transporter substrate binding protein n=1 Tax=Achromobacter denitrificans TaxID=32002 RepID=A0A6N0JEH4_ACHDE|nr:MULTISPECIES: tripartite tricarboxylate transporter substrate binding protein [Achromobacter]ASC65488.1 ABC transporter substrate-binding protein [Achromobacter denitrificans]MBV2159588.1 tripartite tricarboxylate transporter substrate binding protein [Achromobacter denitrificans]MDX3876926.1 tripartite tricarboxylate transporter substrate binding protein [Achromobacter sp.]QCS63758.1 tripartite tricarboxylate transporter substrate binding protein [Achromobacter denitrificans]QKQ45290.1 tri